MVKGGNIATKYNLDDQMTPDFDEINNDTKLNKSYTCILNLTSI